MARVTEEEVKALVPGTKLTDLSPFIAAAGILVDRLAASACGSSLTDAELKEVERWTAAHYVAVADPSVALVSEKVEGAATVASRGNTTLSGILSTQFGQMANTLSGGCLKELDKPNPQVVFV